MARFGLAFVLVALMAACATPALGQEAPEQPSASGGLGNTRADIDLVYGEIGRTNLTDFGDYATESVSYEDEWVFYSIENGITPSADDRAFIIHRYAESGENFPYPELYREDVPGTIWLVLTPDFATGDPGSFFVGVNVRTEHP